MSTSALEQQNGVAAPPELTSCQSRAFALLQSEKNVFLSGAAGTGKSFLIRRLLREADKQHISIVASTGAAAILVEGRTFHSFFGLGIMEDGPLATIRRACGNRNIVHRLRASQTIVIDEISMLSGTTLSVAETIARQTRCNDAPWGGLRIIAVGDFAQLPPVNAYGEAKEWAFLHETWERSSFVPAMLKTVVRTQEPQFLRVLNWIREGIVNDECMDFLNSRVTLPDPAFEGTRLFAHRRTAEDFNLDRLASIQHPLHSFETKYTGDERYIEQLRKHAPIPELLQVKVGALVMLRVNDPDGQLRWVNGSTGYLRSITAESLGIELLDGQKIRIDKHAFSMLNADGRKVASAWNFPVNLAWATTIHKAQGASLDRIMVDLSRLWEPGQAYVALSRARSSDGLFIENWNPGSILVEPLVTQFYVTLERHS